MLTVSTYDGKNADGKTRTVHIEQNEHGRFTWRITKTQGDEAVDVANGRWYDSEERAVNRAAAALKNLAQ
jgi:hypothetical protein